jgi:hypothetical protein
MAIIPSFGSFLFGFSKSRILVMFLLGVIGLVALIFAGMLWYKPQFDRSIEYFVIDRFVNRNELSSIFLSSLSVAIICALPLIVLLPGMDNAITFQVWGSNQPPNVIAVITRLSPILVIGALFGLESTLFLGVSYRHELWHRSAWPISQVVSIVVIVLIIAITLFHWFVLAFQFRIFRSIPGWYYKPLYRPFDIYDGILVFILLALIGIVLWIIHKPGNVFTKLIFIFFLGWCIQLSFGFIEGQGLESLQLKYFQTYHKVYVTSATVETHSFVEIIKNYDDFYSGSRFTFTKPPGVMLTYTAIDRLVNGLDYSEGADVRYARDANFITWIFPLLSLLVVFLLYIFCHNLDASSDSSIVALVAASLFIITPSIDLFVLFADQTIYPFVFLLVVFLVVLGLQQRSLISAFLLGCLLYLALFLSYGLTPLLAFTALYIFVDGWAHRHISPLWRCLLTGIAVIAGFAALSLIFQSLLNYDLIQRMQKVLSFNYIEDFYQRVGHTVPTSPVSFKLRVQQIIQADFLNNIEFATSVGFPVFILFVVQGIRVLVHFFQDKAKRIELLQVAFFGTFLAMNFTGTTQGEVARLWMFLVPLVVFFAAREVLPWAKRRPIWLILLIAAQLLTVALTYHFEDLRM